MYISYIERMKQYFTVGGMPEAVKSWSDNRDPEEVDEILEEIIFAYERDMGKHPDKNDIPKVHYIWDSVASQLARDNKKFLYKAAREGARAREYVKTVSMKRYAAQNDCPLMLRVSLRNITLDGNVLNIPLFLSDRACALIASVQAV